MLVHDSAHTGQPPRSRSAFPTRTFPLSDPTAIGARHEAGRWLWLAVELTHHDVGVRQEGT